MSEPDTSANSDPTTGPRRAFPALAGRVLIIGLDGATWDVLNPLMAEGLMPRLREAVEAGASGILRSTTPPITPAAWTTFLTGIQPGNHGILDFERYDVHTNKLELNSTRCLDHVRNIWQILGDLGFSVGSVNVPMTYPPIPIKGFLVSGFETPGPDRDFVHPASLKKELLARWPDPTVRKSWKRKRFRGVAQFEKNVAYASRSFHQGAAMTKWLGDRHGWDVLMVVLKLVDNLQHKTWKYLDPRWAHRDSKRAEITKRSFSEADRAVGELVDYARRHDATVLMVSDHGHGSLDGKVQPNLLLQRWGYLALEGGGAQFLTRGRYLIDRALGRTRKFARQGDVLHDLAVDFSRTKACVMHAGMAGFVYLNLKGRQPKGIVGPETYESLRDELRSRFLGPECRTKTPDGEEVAMFTEAHKPEELYGCTREKQPWMPDLILTPRDGLAVVRRIRGRSPVQWLSYRRIEGTHRPDGILVATGPHVAKVSNLRAHIMDCAPTLLAMLGLRVPDDMQGRVMTELFDTSVTVETEAATTVATTAARTTATDDVYSQDDLDAVTDRLQELGYLE